MAIAYSWVQYANTSDFTLLPGDLPFLDFGVVDPSSQSDKIVIGLKFQGTSVTNILIWRDSDDAIVQTIDNSGNESAPTFAKLSSRGYTFYGLADPVTNESTYVQTIDNWNVFPTTQMDALGSVTALSLGDAYLTEAFTSYSLLCAIGVATGAETGNAHVDISNMRLLASFDTTDDITAP